MKYSRDTHGSLNTYDDRHAGKALIILNVDGTDRWFYFKNWTIHHGQSCALYRTSTTGGSLNLHIFTQKVEVEPITGDARNDL